MTAVHRNARPTRPADRPDSALASPYMDVSYVEAVVAMPDPVERNRAITRGYHELALAMGAVVGRDNANWLCFGQWASAEAGRAIRGDSVPALARPVFGDEVTEAVAAGNAAVFGDVAPPFIRFIRAFTARPEAQTDPVAAAQVLADLHSHPQIAPSEDLRRAFTAYTDALLMGSSGGPAAARARAQRFLVANASIGAHEQIVADPHVRAAIPGAWIVAIAATAHMVIHLPDGKLFLNRDVPHPDYLSGAPFPVDLIDLDDADAVALATRFGQDLESAEHSDAPNWEDYHERMGYIFSLLRAYQQDGRIFALPPDRVAEELAS